MIQFVRTLRLGKEHHMKKKSDLKKMTLSRDTLRQLTAKQAQVVQGAVMVYTYYCTSDSVQACCA